MDQPRETGSTKVPQGGAFTQKEFYDRLKTKQEEQAEGLSREKRIESLKYHFKVDDAVINRFIRDMEKLPDPVKKQLAGAKEKYQKLQDEFKRVSTANKIDEDKLRHIVNEIKQFRQSLVSNTKIETLRYDLQQQGSENQRLTEQIKRDKALKDLDTWYRGELSNIDTELEKGEKQQLDVLREQAKQRTGNIKDKYDQQILAITFHFSHFPDP